MLAGCRADGRLLELDSVLFRDTRAGGVAQTGDFEDNGQLKLGGMLRNFINLSSTHRAEEVAQCWLDVRSRKWSTRAGSSEHDCCLRCPMEQPYTEHRS